MNKSENFNRVSLMQYNAILNVALANNDSTDVIKTKILKFEDIEGKENAKMLYNELFSETQGKSAFFVNGVEISVCDTDKLFRICADFNDEFISYEFN